MIRRTTRYNHQVKEFIKSSYIQLITWGFNLLYHQFAWMYSFAAWLVSAGRWDNWIRSLESEIPSGPVLEIGCGKGVLLDQLKNRDGISVGLDESPNMLRYSKKRVITSGNLIRGIGQNLPFANQSFRIITSTFPAPYIFESETLEEINRVLSTDGVLIILLTAFLTGNSMHEKVIRFGSKFSGFSNIDEKLKSRITSKLNHAGLEAHFFTRIVENSTLTIFHASPYKSK